MGIRIIFCRARHARTGWRTLMLITDGYIEEQKVLHFKHLHSNKYGSGGPQFAELINGICAEQNIHELLDYGCGKAVLQKCLNASIHYQGYDPAIEQYSALPQPSDLVVCLDVLEHIEPECLKDVLQHLAWLSKRLLFVSISMQQAQSGRFLSDGRNAHLIIENDTWWKDKMEDCGFYIAKTYPPTVKSKMEWVALMERQNGE